jgi:hypothetical protein
VKIARNPRNNVLTLVIAAHFSRVSSYAQSNGHSEIIQQKVQVVRATFTPGQIYRDSLASGGEGPEMLVLPGGGVPMLRCESDRRWT